MTRLTSSAGAPRADGAFRSERRGLLTFREAATWLNQSEDKVRRMHAAGRLTALRVGERSWRVPATEVDRLLAQAEEGDGHGDGAADRATWLTQAARLRRELEALRRRLTAVVVEVEEALEGLPDGDRSDREAGR
jgi:excisionase family DNA binding protein